ncbi:MAG: IMP dehydrogenase [Bacteroidales bacterium]|nr:IMP dehydrogenase [Bacteroidales bacterium]
MNLIEGLTFDDVLLVPGWSEVLPREVSLQTRFSRNISLQIPLVSAAMDTVTEAPMAIALSRAGGIGVLHKNMSAELQAAEVRKVKAASPEGADSPNLDGQGRLRVAAGVGITADVTERVRQLLEAGVDAIVLDSAHGHSKGVRDALLRIKDSFPGLDVVVGNIATAEAARCLAEAGADGIKVGIGPGSICTTRIVAGVGVPQLTAIYDAAQALKGSGIPVIADGGLRYSGDLVKALAAGGDCVMCGSLFAGTDEAPGEVVEFEGKQMKIYRGMGSTDAMRAGSWDRYFQSGAKKLVPEGIVGCVRCKGSVEDVIFQLLGGIRAGMGYCGAPDIPALRNAKFIHISTNAVRENHPHDITIAKSEPNYSK